MILVGPGCSGVVPPISKPQPTLEYIYIYKLKKKKFVKCSIYLASNLVQHSFYCGFYISAIDAENSVETL